MKRITATAVGMILATGLAIAAPKDTPTDLVQRYYSVQTTDLAASWRDWHPDALHRIEIKTGDPNSDIAFGYHVSDWEDQLGWTEDPALSEALEGYEETHRSAPELTASTSGNDTIVTAQSRVEYIWDGHTGTMTQTDKFHIATVAGNALIRNLTTVYDYR